MTIEAVARAIVARMPGRSGELAREVAIAAIEAHEAALAAHGYIIVPREPTEEMKRAVIANARTGELIDSPVAGLLMDSWRAMIAAAPDVTLRKVEG